MKDYLGDGVYAEFDRFGDIILTTENGIATTNRIVLEPEVWLKLVQYVTKILDAKECLGAPPKP